MNEISKKIIYALCASAFFLTPESATADVISDDVALSIYWGNEHSPRDRRLRYRYNPRYTDDGYFDGYYYYRSGDDYYYIDLEGRGDNHGRRFWKGREWRRGDGHRGDGDRGDGHRGGDGRRGGEGRGGRGHH